jgi:hypothetical protein
LPGQKRVIIFLILIVFSLFLDSKHLVKTSDNGLAVSSAATETRDESYWAYQKLMPAARNRGPGLIFSDFVLLDRGHTLNVACYHFNALLNPEFQFNDAQWAGIVTNVHYVPFLLRRFPGSQWYRITPDRTEDGGSAVGIVPITPQNQSTFKKWAVAHQYFHQLSIQAENTMNNKDQYLSDFQRLPEGLPLMAGDPFLEACFGEWAAQYHFGPDFGPNIRAIQRAIQMGYPTANLYYKLGNFYLINHQPDEAHQAYLKAAACVPNYTNVKETLSYLESSH